MWAHNSFFHFSERSNNLLASGSNAWDQIVFFKTKCRIISRIIIIGVSICCAHMMNQPTEDVTNGTTWYCALKSLTQIKSVFEQKFNTFYSNQSFLNMMIILSEHNHLKYCLSWIKTKQLRLTFVFVVWHFCFLIIFQ